MEKSKTDAQDASQRACTEAQLRDQLVAQTQAAHASEALLQDSKRSVMTLQTELQNVQAQVLQLEHHKIQWERERRAWVSTTTADGGSSIGGGTDYYKRKVTELTTQVQGLRTVIAEKTAIIDDLHRQRDRSTMLMNKNNTNRNHNGQQRFHRRPATTQGGKGGISTKKTRHSF